MQITGEISNVAQGLDWNHPGGAPVLLRHDGRVIGGTTVDEHNRFAVEVDGPIVGDVEIEVALIGVAPLTVHLDGDEDEVDVTVLYNPLGKEYA